MENNLVLISSAVVCKEEKDKKFWFVVKHSENGDWELPRTIVRKGESSVRAAIRMMGEQGGMTAQVLEEAGRAGGVTNINGKVLPQRHLYYLMIEQSEAGEAIGFEECEWLEFSQATKKLASKREKGMLKQAKRELTVWKKKQKDKKDTEEVLEEIEDL